MPVAVTWKRGNRQRKGYGNSLALDPLAERTYRIRIKDAIGGTVLKTLTVEGAESRTITDSELTEAGFDPTAFLGALGIAQKSTIADIGWGYEREIIFGTGGASVFAGDLGFDGDFISPLNTGTLFEGDLGFEAEFVAGEPGAAIFSGDMGFEGAFVAEEPGPGDPRATFLGAQLDPANQTIYEFDIDLGAEDPDRMAVVGVATSATGSRNVSAITINGISATVVHNHGSGTRHFSMWRANVPTGGVVTVSVTMTGGCVNMSLLPWRAVPSSQTPNNVNSAAVSSVDAVSANIDVVSGGFVIAAQQIGGISSNEDVTYTGADTLTLDASGDNENHHVSAASGDTSETATRTAGFTGDNGTAARRLIVASWL